MTPRTVTFPVSGHRATHAEPGFVSMLPAAALWIASLLALLMSAFAAVAQDPPSRVGRLSDVGGNVFLSPDNSESGWQPVGINYPVTIGDNVWVSQDGRAEIDFGAGQLRLANEANVHFTQLDERQFSAFLANGRAKLRLRFIEAGEAAKLDTPNAQIDILRPGSYRLDTNADTQHTTIVVREGEVELRVGDRVTRVHSGQTAAVEGNGFGAAMMVRDGYGTDSFDSYALDRDRRIESVGQSSQYVSSYVPGVSDLDAYGQWETAPTYGAVWYPRTVATDWVPYRDGQWAYVQPWGWTWVDNAPWGWAPFHYGRWVRVGPRWAWCPGEFVRRPVYSPALVAWYGGASGTSWSSGFSGPTFGWVPLSWGEPYWPQYRHSTEYWRRTNQPVAVDVRRFSERPPQRYNYVNARIPGAVTAAPAEVLSNRRPVGPNHYVVPPQTLANAPLTTAPIAVRPTLHPMTIDKLPPRAPTPAGTYAGRPRPDFRAPQSVQGQAPAPMPAPGAGGGRPIEPSMGGRAGNSGVPYTGQPGMIQQPQPSALVPQQGGVRPLPGAGAQGGAPGGVTGGMPGAIPGGAPTLNDPRAVGGQMYMPTNRPQPGPRQQQIEPLPSTPQSAQPSPMPVQPPTVNRPAMREPHNPGLNSTPAPQPLPQPQSIAPQPAPQPIQQPQYNPQRQRPMPGTVREGAPVAPMAVPQPPAQMAAPPVYVPQQMPQRPIQRAPVQQPAPMPVMPAPMAPAPTSIAPAPQSIAPAPSSIAPAPRPLPQHRGPEVPGPVPSSGPGGR